MTGLFADLRGSQPWIRRGGYALAGITALYVGSLALVGLPSSWDWGHVLVAALWSFVAVLLVFTRLRAWGLALLAATVALVVVYDVPFIAEVERSWSFAIAAAAAFVFALVWEHWSFDEAIEWPAVAALIASVGLAAASAAELLDGDRRAWAFLALAAVYGLTGVAVLRTRRDFASALEPPRWRSRSLRPSAWLVACVACDQAGFIKTGLDLTAADFSRSQMASLACAIFLGNQFARCVRSRRYPWWECETSSISRWGGFNRGVVCTSGAL